MQKLCNAQSWIVWYRSIWLMVAKITKCQTGKRALSATHPFSYHIDVQVIAANANKNRAAGLLPWDFPDFVRGGGDPHHDTREWGDENDG
jgi:hypothetical protein